MGLFQKPSPDEMHNPPLTTRRTYCIKRPILHWVTVVLIHYSLYPKFLYLCWFLHKNNAVIEFKLAWLKWWICPWSNIGKAATFPRQLPEAETKASWFIYAFQTNIYTLREISVSTFPPISLSFIALLMMSQTSLSYVVETVMAKVFPLDNFEHSWHE